MKSMILAADEKWAIGNSTKENGLPWESISEDFAHFQKVTKEVFYLIMGRVTWEVVFRLLKKPFPKRETNILSQSLKEPPHPDTHVFSSVEEFQDYIKNRDYCVTGGAETYRAFINHVDEIIMTKVHGTFPADCWFDHKLLENFYEDKTRMKTLREASEGKHLVTVHYYKRIGGE